MTEMFGHSIVMCHTKKISTKGNCRVSYNLVNFASDTGDKNMRGLVDAVHRKVVHNFFVSLALPLIIVTGRKEHPSWILRPQTENNVFGTFSDIY